ncbi:restriction endonuclease subunit S [Vibrio splendidus]|uniref:restriction endonuclease subunit S n=1 Tax=Vibrio splendidus TaxID=29497 RepID=UPI000E328F35|nr:restriction endonuclease subunit S [Vibrio splendidus]
MTVEKKVPEIRFTGFSGEWTEKELNKEVELFSGLTYSPKDVRKEGVFVIRSSNVKNGQLVNADNVYVNPEVVNCSNVKKGDIIVVVRNGSRSLIGKHAQVNSCMAQTVIGAFMTGFRGKQPEFINALFDTKQFTAQVEKNLGATINQITNGAFNSMVFMFPEELEQTSIGNIIQKIDSLINQHQQKHDKLSHLKKAMLERCFPKQGETVPEIRFKGFVGEWEEMELSDEVTFINGRAYSQEELQVKGKYKVLRVGNFYTNSSWYYSDMELGDKYYADFGDLLYTWSASFGPHIWNGDKVIYHYHIWKLELSKKVDKLFLLHLLDYDRAKILSGSNGSTMIHITKSAMEAKKVFVPKKDEQIAIGNYFQKLDTLIDQHQQQITKLTNIKQACLSKMFV